MSWSAAALTTSPSLESNVGWWELIIANTRGFETTGDHARPADAVGFVLMRVIVTGAKTGVGHQVVIACRSLSKAQHAGEAIAYEVSSQATGPRSQCGSDGGCHQVRQGSMSEWLAILRLMRIDVQSWEKLNHRLSTSQTKPPIAVYLLVHTLTGGADIETSWAESKSQDSTTVWRNWVMTESLFVHTEVEFGAANFEQAAEDQAGRSNPGDGYVQPMVRRAWARPLASIVSLDVGTVGQLSGFRGDWYPVDGVVLTFADGLNVSLPGQTDVASDEHDRSDQFLAAVRSRLSF